jgi:Replication initiator protein A
MKPAMEISNPIDLVPEAQVEVIRLGKDEMNLAEFPIALLSDRVPKGKQSIQYEDQIFDEKTGKRITRRLTIKAPDEEDGKSGLPTATDNDVILGLIQLTKIVNNFTCRDVEFSRLDFIRLLGWPDSGDSYARLTKSLKCWLSVTLLYENAWRDNRKGTWLTKGFHILDNIELNDTRSYGVQGELFPSKITWNKVVFDSFEAGYLKSIDYGFYVQLRHAIAKQLYRFLSKRMYFGPDLTFDLRDLAFAHVGLSETYMGNAAKIKEKLQPALEELEAMGFLEPMAKEERYQKQGKNWTIRLIAKARPRALSEAHEQFEPLPDPLVIELVNRGVSKLVAAGLVKGHPADFIQAKIEVTDWLKERKDKRVSQNPAGYLVKSIREDYALPDGFTPAAERQKQAEARKVKDRAEAEERRRKHEADAQACREKELINGFWDGLSKEQKAEHEAAAIAQANAEELKLIEPGPFKKYGMSSIRLSYARKLLQSQGKFPPAEA